MDPEALALEREVAGDAEKTPVKTPVETPEKTPDRIMALLRMHPELTLVEIAGNIDKSPRAVERAVAKLVGEERLRHIGPKKTGHCEVIDPE